MSNSLRSLWIHNLNSKVSDSLLTHVGLHSSLDHDVQVFEHKWVKEFSLFVLGHLLTLLLILLGWHTDECFTVFSGEVDIKWISKVRDLSTNHIRGFEVGEGLIAVFASISSSVFDDLLAAVIVGTCRVEDFILILNPCNVAIDGKDMSVVIIIFFSERLFNLTNQL